MFSRRRPPHKPLHLADVLTPEPAAPVDPAVSTLTATCRFVCGHWKVVSTVVWFLIAWALVIGVWSWNQAITPIRNSITNIDARLGRIEVKFDQHMDDSRVGSTTKPCPGGGIPVAARGDL
jgi:hypothetical protein